MVNDWFSWTHHAYYWGLPKMKVTKKLPEALIAILVVSAIVISSNLEVATVGSFIRDGGGEGLRGGFPSQSYRLSQKFR